MNNMTENDKNQFPFPYKMEEWQKNMIKLIEEGKMEIRPSLRAIRDDSGKIKELQPRELSLVKGNKPNFIIFDEMSKFKEVKIDPKGLKTIDVPTFEEYCEEVNKLIGTPFDIQYGACREAECLDWNTCKKRFHKSPSYLGCYKQSKGLLKRCKNCNHILREPYSKHSEMKVLNEKGRRIGTMHKWLCNQCHFMNYQNKYKKRYLKRSEREQQGYLTYVKSG